MGNIAGLDDLVLRLTGGGSNSAPENIPFFIDPRVGGVAAVVASGHHYSLWQYSKHPGEGATPTSVAIPDNTTAGGLQQTNPAGGNQKWLLGLYGTLDASAGGGILILYDRLLHIGGFNGTTITAQTVGGSITRYTNGIGNLVFAEIYTAIGTTARTFTCSYTNQAGAAGQTSLAAEIGGAGFREIQRMCMMTPAAGDFGVQAVASLTLSASTATAGNFGVTIAHPLAWISTGHTGSVSEGNFVVTFPAPIEILPSACLAFAYVPLPVTGPSVVGQVITVCA